ncbi:MAG: GntR family transcriptional regulator [Spirochaetaceae bacterium]
MKTSAEKAYTIILNAVKENILPRNTFLSQRKLAEMAGTSIISVREALKRLEQEGVFEAIPKWGVRIPEASKERLIETYQVREGIETMVAYILSQHVNAEDKKHIYRLAEECDNIKVEGRESIIHFSEKHQELHLYMAGCTGNTQLREQLERIGLRIIIYQSAKFTWFQQVENWEYWHRGLVDKIFSGDTSLAQQAMHEHIQHGLHYDIRYQTAIQKSENL